ncbi:MAG: hypothetical protein JOZ41_18815, partial [Chloroflexi bacterium]|nr:hypothetical protein [Chloroflexota bacterium]
MDSSPQQDRGKPVFGKGRWSPGRAAVAGGILIVVLAAAALGFAATRSSPQAPYSRAQTIDGIRCLGNEALDFHIHQHLDLYDHGTHVLVPAYIGIPNNGQYATCYYWIHVHDQTGVIHVESPIQRQY